MIKPMIASTSLRSLCFPIQNPQNNQPIATHMCAFNPLSSRKLLRFGKFKEMLVPRPQTINRSCTGNLDDVRFRAYGLSDEAYGCNAATTCAVFARSSCSMACERRTNIKNQILQCEFDVLEPMMLGIRPEPPDWPERDAIMFSIIERKAKSLELPLSLRMIKKRQKLEGSFEKSSGCCSVKKALSLVVFIVVELQSHALKMREPIYQEDLDMIVNKVRSEMRLSFAWLFQQVFASTPALMISVMILLGNFSVHSASQNIAVAETSILASLPETITETSLIQEKHNQRDSNIDSRTSGSTNKDRNSGNLSFSTQIPDLHEKVSEFDSGTRSPEEEHLWNEMSEEAAEMGTSLEDGVMQRFVSPVSVEIESDDYVDYSRTDLRYQMNLSQDPHNQLLLCNYARFLHLVVGDHDRAEECFKRAVEAEPPDAEALSQYADFLWTGRNDLCAAEQKHLQALATEPQNTYYASRYANFLWNTGGEDTCFPLDSLYDTPS